MCVCVCGGMDAIGGFIQQSGGIKMAQVSCDLGGAGVTGHVISALCHVIWEGPGWQVM